MPISAELEPVAVRAWPAAETERTDSWLLRSTGGYTDRANSVAVLGETGESVLDDAVSAAERFYAKRSRPAQFQLSDVDSTASLRAELERRGYQAEKPTVVRVADVGTLAGAGPDRAVALMAEPTDAWFDLWWSIDGRGAHHRTTAGELLRRMPAMTTFASVTEDGAVVGVALGVVDSGWLGLFCAATDPVARGRQLAGSVTATLATWGAANGATRAYCQVGAGNTASLRLTDRAGFTDAYSYRYYVKPDPI